MNDSENVLTSVLEIDGIGPIVQRRFQIPKKGGGLRILRGKNGVGKTWALKAARTAVGAKERLSRNDDADVGAVTFAGRTVKIAIQQKPSGAKLDDLEICHIETIYDISTLVEPQLDKAEDRDKERIKALVQLSGGKLDFSVLEELVKKSGAEISIEKARSINDTVERHESAKRLLEAEARRIEELAKGVRADQASLEGEAKRVSDEYGGLNFPHDSSILAHEHETAITQHAALQQRAETAEQQKQARTDATKRRAKAIDAYKGNKSTDTAIDLEVAGAEDSLAAEAVRDLEAKLEVAKAKRRDTERTLQTAQAAHDKAIGHETLVAEYDRTLASELAQGPTEDELKVASENKIATHAANSRGVVIRSALDAKDKAAKKAIEAEELETKAVAIREAAHGAIDLLAKAISCPELTVKAGRLMFVGGPELEQFDRLSDGERYKIAVQIGARRVSEKTGDGTRLLILPQTGYQDLDPDERAVVNDIAQVEEIVVLTAECSTGDLRIVSYEESLVENLKLAQEQNGQVAG